MGERIDSYGTGEFFTQEDVSLERGVRRLEVIASGFFERRIKFSDKESRGVAFRDYGVFDSGLNFLYGVA